MAILEQEDRFLYLGLNMKTRISCFSFVRGKSEAKSFLETLNSLKSSDSYFEMMDGDGENSYMIVGDVTDKDWDKLNLSEDFMEM